MKVIKASQLLESMLKENKIQKLRCDVVSVQTKSMANLFQMLEELQLHWTNEERSNKLVSVKRF